MREPPLWARLWLAWTLPRGERGDSIVGDLAEEYARRADGGDAGRPSARGAARWYARQALSVGGWYALERVRRRIRRRPRGHSGQHGHGGGRRREGGVGMTAGFLYDLRHALRGLARSPGYTLGAVLVLALAIAANARAFAGVDGLSFRPLPVDEPERLVAIYGERRDSRFLGFSYQDWTDYREGTRGAFEDVAGVTGTRATLAGADGAVMVWAELVTPNWFAVVRPHAAVGRLLRPDDEEAAVLSHAFWVRHFGADPAAVGRRVTVNGEPFTVVGVTGPRYFGTRLATWAPDVWLPVVALERVQSGAEGRLGRRAGGWLHLVGRLEPGVSVERGGASADGVATALAASYPDSHGGRAATLVPNERAENAAGRGFTDEEVRFQGLLSMAGVALILLIACANVANLQLARALARRREVAVRMSLGAGRGRVVRQRIAESLLVSLSAGALGIGLALLAQQRFSSSGDVSSLEFLPALDVSIEWRAVLFTLLAATLAGLLAGAWPALRESRADPAAAMKAAAGGAARTPRLLDVLVVGQVAASAFVLVAAVLLVRSLENRNRIGPGFPLENGLMMTLEPSLSGYGSAEVRDLYERLTSDLRALPGVRRVSRSSNIPLSGTYPPRRRITAEGAASEDDVVSAESYAAEPGWLETLGMPLEDGRDFTAADTAGAPPVAIVNRALARRLDPEGRVVGRWIGVGQGRTAEVVGVLRDLRAWGLQDGRSAGGGVEPMIVSSLRQEESSRSMILVRTAVAPEALIPDVRRVVAGIDPTLALIGPRTLEQGTGAGLSFARNGVRQWGTYGLLALLLTVAGLYGVVAYGVTRRRREIGIRMALGARRTHVGRMVVRRGIRLVVMGLVLGAAGSVALSGVVGRLVYGVSPTDPGTFAGVGAVILAIGVLASWLPARAATRVDPIQVLRAE